MEWFGFVLLIGFLLCLLEAIAAICPGLAVFVLFGSFIWLACWFIGKHPWASMTLIAVWLYSLWAEAKAKPAHESSIAMGVDTQFLSDREEIAVHTEGLATPEHYRWVAEDLHDVLREIELAFFDRPLPKGPPLPNHELWELMRRVQESAADVTIAVNDMTVNVLSNAAVRRDSVRAFIETIRDRVRKLVAVFHGFWERPLHTELIHAQAGFSAVPEALLRRCHSCFRNFVDLVSLDLSAWKEQGSTEVVLRLNLDVRQEIEQLKCCFPPHRFGPAKADDPWLLWAAIGVLLGAWID